MSTSDLTRPGRALTALADEINAEHAAAERAINDSLQHARRCGELLNEAKARCAHGEWGDWLRDNFRASERTARGYMMLARRWQELPPQNGNALPIREALAALAEPREPAPMTRGEARELTERINAQLARPEVRDAISALAAIRDGRLYRPTHPDFAAYCQSRHGIPAHTVEVLGPLLDAAGAA